MPAQATPEEVLEEAVEQLSADADEPTYDVDEDFESTDDVQLSGGAGSNSVTVQQQMGNTAAAQPRSHSQQQQAADQQPTMQQERITSQQQQQQQQQQKQSRRQLAEANNMQQQAQQHTKHHEHQDKAQLLTQQYLQSLQRGKRSSSAAATDRSTVQSSSSQSATNSSAANGNDSTGSTHSNTSHRHSNTNCSSSSSPTAAADKPGSRPATANNNNNRPFTTPAVLLTRPLSAQLKSWPAAAAAAATTQSAAAAAAAGGHCSTWPPAGGPAIGNAGRRSSSCSPAGRLQSPPRLRHYSPGPGAYSPRTDRKGLVSFAGSERGSFPSAARYQGSYIDMFAKTIHSPGPIYYPQNDTCCSSSCSAGDSSSSSAAHSAAGTWNRADVGSRETLLVHSCGCTSNSSKSPSGKHAVCDTNPQQHTCQGHGTAASASSGGAAACAACAVAGWAVPGPGQYDAAVGRDGRGVALTQSCPAFSVPKAGKLLAGRHAPYISARHALHDNQGSCSPGPVYAFDAGATRPSSCSPTMQARGHNHWEQLSSSGSASSARQVLGHSPISRTSKHLLGDGPRTHFGTASLDFCPWLSKQHANVLNRFKHGAEAHYNPRYSQLDAHVGFAVLVSGPEDRFDDKWLPGSGRLQ